MEKPKIERWFGLWRCSGLGITGYGRTKRHAYANWKALLEIGLEYGRT